MGIHGIEQLVFRLGVLDESLRRLRDTIQPSPTSNVTSQPTELAKPTTAAPLTTDFSELMIIAARLSRKCTDTAQEMHRMCSGESPIYAGDIRRFKQPD